MSRYLPLDVIAELNKDAFKMAHLIKIDFSTPVYVTDNDFDIVYMNATYEAGGHLINISSINETSDLRVNTISIQLSGVQQAHVATLLTGNYLDRNITIYRVYLNDSGSIIGHPIMMHTGGISHFAINTDDDTCEIDLSASNHWANFDLKSGRKTNDNSQRTFFPNDQGMMFSGLMTQDIKWGRV